jgi:hypothetical protein
MATTLTVSGTDLRFGKRPARGRSHGPARSPIGRLAVPTLAAALAVAVVSAMVAEAARTPAAAVSAAPAVAAGTMRGDARTTGVFTGEYQNGVPVYRLPPVTVVGDRKADVAAIRPSPPEARSRARPSG